MRKDVRLGMAIGGVLLLVVVVYLIIGSFKKPNTVATGASGDNPAALSGDDSLRVTDIKQPGSESETPAPHDAHAETPAPGPAHDVSSSTGDAPDNKTWLMMLNGDDAVAHARPVTPGPIGEALAGASTDRRGSSGRTDSGTALLPPLHPDGAAAAPRGSDDAASATQPAGRTAATPRTHKVQPGETYAKISAEVYGSSKYFAAIEEANPGIEPTRLKPGITINLPDIAAAHTSGPRSSAVPAAQLFPASDATHYVVKSGDTLYRISKQLYGNANMVEKLYDLNKDRIGPDSHRLKIGEVLKLPSAPRADQPESPVR